MKHLKITLVASIFLFALFAFKPHLSDKWLVPEKYEKMKNPTDKADKENKTIGKNLFAKHCASCHGKEGYGDGPKAANLDGDLGDFSSEETQGQTDGALFYKIITGRGDMTGFRKTLTDDEDVWLIVNHVRTLAD